MPKSAKSLSINEILTIFRYFGKFGKILEINNFFFFCLTQYFTSRGIWIYIYIFFLPKIPKYRKKVAQTLILQCFQIFGILSVFTKENRNTEKKKDRGVFLILQPTFILMFMLGLGLGFGSGFERERVM